MDIQPGKKIYVKDEDGQLYEFQSDGGEHDASEITTGVLAVERGGTGRSDGTVSYANTAGTASNATYANTAGTAMTANNATYANSSGTATSATTATTATKASTLVTARTFRTNLAATANVTFNGAANCTLGVTGVLPVANGGTGNSTGLVANATYATSAGSATSATTATTATNATYATTAGSASTLTTTRYLRTNLALAGNVAFNGSANCTAGIVGTLPVSYGGTGTTSLTTHRAQLGLGYGTCSTAAGTTAKTVSISSFVRYTGAMVSVLFTYASTSSSATLNVNSTGAGAIWKDGVAIGSGVISAGDLVTFVFSGSYWRIVSIDSLQTNLASALEGVYGVTWDGTSTTQWSRTDGAVNFADPTPSVNGGYGSSPFDNILPWSGMERVTDSEGGELVAIPKFYYKWTQSGTAISLQISHHQAEGFYCSPAHADRGDGSGERDVIYVGRYHCDSSYKSTTGVAQRNSITRDTARTSIAALGSTIWQWDYATNWTIKMLYLVEFADWNSQSKIGRGCATTSNSAAVNGQTDSMSYHTGTTESTRTSYGYTQYRNIEGLWDNRYDWLDGCYYSSTGLNIIMNPNNFSNTANGTSVGIPTNGYPSVFTLSTVSSLEWAIYPTTSSGSTSTYLSDYWVTSSSYPCLYVGGGYGQSLDRGLFSVGCNSVTFTSSFVGCRLQKLP